VKVGIVCPYTWDVPGGVQAHVHDLALSLIELGHDVSVLAPVDDADEADLPSWVVPAGRAVPVPYNGSVARLAFGPVSLTRTRRWLRKGRFDVLHLHEPTVPSLSMLACFAARGPMVATFHTATVRSRALQVFGNSLQPGLEKITGRIAVSPAARRVVVEHLGHDAVLVPNGVFVQRFEGAAPLDGLPAGPRVVFLGRIDEPRKGLATLLDALPALVARVPDVHLVVAGPGDTEVVADHVPAHLRDRVVLLGLVSEADKPRVYASGDAYCAPNTHGESFGIVLIEAMAAGTPVVASDLEAFRRVLGDGDAGVLVPVGDAGALAEALADLLLDPERLRLLSAAGSRVVQAYDWRHVARQVVAVYETVAAAAPVVLDESADEPDVEDYGQEDDPGRLSETLRRWLAAVRDRSAT
jgi:phosphatidylinositol alpha-mannosyltransferase